MNWPINLDYSEAIQNPRQNLGDDELRKGLPHRDKLGLPIGLSGNFAIVFRIDEPATGRRWAVKCFTREVENLRDRYREISAHLTEAKGNLPFIVNFDYLDRGILIRGRWYPILKMDWVEGFTLNKFVTDYLHKSKLLVTLAEKWVQLSRCLCDTQTTHADLQHGNVLLVPGVKEGKLSIKLIDYDGMHVPKLAKNPSGELGHDNYQHPQRSRDRLYSPEMDRFPSLVIYCALRCVAVEGQSLWTKYNNDDNLLFCKQDLSTPGQSALIRELWRLSDPRVHPLVGHLILASQGLQKDVPLLSDLVDNSGNTRSLNTDQVQKVEQILRGANSSPATSATATTSPAGKWYNSTVPPFPPSIPRKLEEDELVELEDDALDDDALDELEDDALDDDELDELEDDEDITPGPRHSTTPKTVMTPTKRTQASEEDEAETKSPRSPSITIGCIVWFALSVSILGMILSLFWYAAWEQTTYHNSGFMARSIVANYSNEEIPLPGANPGTRGFWACFVISFILIVILIARRDANSRGQ